MIKGDPPNPYVAPRAASVAAVARAHTRGQSLKWIFLAVLSAGPLALYFAGPNKATLAIALAGMVLTPTLGLTWFLVAWATVPAEDRHGTELGRYSLFWVFMRFFIPLYGTFWLFASMLILCKAINHSLIKREMPVRASALVGIASMIAFWLVYAFAPRDLNGIVTAWTVAGALWFLFMLQTDHARRFMILACLAEREQNDATRRSLAAR
jgi:hypothetical protein